MSAPARAGGPADRGRTAVPRRRSPGVATDKQSGVSTAGARVGSGGRTRSTAAERAYARRAQRIDQAKGTGGARQRQRQRPRSDQATGSRASFVVLVIGLLTTGVVATLWLSTQAIADSYRLDRAKKAATELSEQVESLQREVAQLDSPSRIADEAAKAGMVDSGEPGRLVLQSDGKVVVAAQPQPAPGGQSQQPAEPQQPAQPSQPADQQPADQQPADQQAAQLAAQGPGGH
jgi:cell division protein FtsL